MGNSQASQQFPKNFIETKREEHSILGNISYILNKEANKKYIMCEKTFMIQSQFNSYYKKIMHRKQLMSSQNHTRVNRINKHMINIAEIKCSQFSELCGKTFKIHLFIQQFQSDLKKQFNQRRYKSAWFKEKQVLQVLLNATNSLIAIYDNNVKSYHLSLDSIVSVNGIYKIIDADLTSKTLPIYDFLNEFKLKRGIYISPEHIQLQQESLSGGTQFFYQNPKSDIFTLGVLLIQLMSLDDMFQAYDYSQKKIYFQIIQNRIKLLKKRYSPKLIKILQEMLVQQHSQRIGLLGLKQMTQSKRQSNNQKKDEDQIESHNQDLQIDQQQAYQDKGRQQTKISKLVGYHRLYNNKLATSRSKKSNSFYEASQQSQQIKDKDPYQIINYTNSRPENRNKQKYYKQDFNLQENHAIIMVGNQHQKNSTDTFINHYNHENGYKNNSNIFYQTGSTKQAISWNQSFQKNKLNLIGNQFSKNSRISHSSDLPVSPITNIGVNNLPVSPITNVAINNNKNTNDQSKKGQTSLTGFNNNILNEYQYKAYQTKNFKQQEAINKQKTNFILVNQQKTKRNNNLQAIGHNYYQPIKRYSQNYIKGLSSMNQNNSFEPNYSHMNQQNYYSVNKQSEKNKIKSYQLQIKPDTISQAQYNFVKKVDLQTPRNVNRKNIYSINTVKYQQKCSPINSSRSTPVKNLQLVQTNKKEYQEMNKTTFGRYDFSNGAIYEGQFNESNEFQGNGVLYYPNGKICYSGGWLQNCFHSFGVLYNQQIITQTPTTHKPTNYQDFNKNDSNNWIQYEGEFVQDKKNGFGSLLMSNGDKFSGCFVNDIIQGFGTFYIKASGQNINGIWINNILQK